MRRLAGALTFALLAAPGAAEELSIRNVTGETVRFRLKTASEGGDTHTLAPGQILRLDGDASRGIFFQSAGREREYRLEAGGSYSFRYDDARQLELFLGSHGRDDAPDLAPFVATPIPVARRMLEMAGVTEDDLVVDLGCGDGRLVVEAARRYGARGLGVDLDPRLVAASLLSTAGAILSGWVFRPNELAPDAIRAQFFTLFFRGLESAEPSAGGGCC